jgi:hypothetical protein
MGLTTAIAALAAVAGIGGLAASAPALAIPAASTAASITAPAPAGVAASAGAGSAANATAAASAMTVLTSTTSTTSAPSATSAPAAQPGSDAAASPSASSASGASGASGAPRCDDGSWRGPGGINVNGRPDNFDAGDRGAAYVWHGPDGWHLRTTDVTDTAHHYTGTIALSAGARFTSFSPVRLENGDRVWVDGENVLHYDFTTYNGIDGVDWTVSACDRARDDETMRFSMDVNGHEDDPSRIDLGDAKQHPGSATFVVTREI